jgi:HEAT repeat protein
MHANLSDPDKNTRLRAVMALGQDADPSALPALLERLRLEPDFYVRDNLSWAIARCGAAAVEPLMALLTDDDTSTRYHAAHALSKIGDPRAVDALVSLLDDRDADVAQKAVFALGRIGDARALPALVAAIGTGSRELQTRRSEALEAFGEAAVPALEPMLSHADVAVRVAVTEVLGGIGGDVVAVALARAATDAEWDVRFAALNALRGSKSVAAREAMERALRDEDARVRVLATRLLSEVVG